MFDDPHLRASGSLENVTLPDGTRTRLPVVPIELDGERLGRDARLSGSGADTRDILGALGLSPADIESLIAAGVVGSA
jgi:crotonobetainyl-CoA:carnitine CoA-transferase CaiB-like acyl-CoA transferase